ncbi:hypothetical protein A9W99_10170 [Mycobacterium sp. 1164966.3]|uniref:DUF2505 domain-containing protein n=1 Tax=Mycobacterium sp. 1164966.3 TaxID=1856861 RepID=UPI0008024FC1|nr:DUF2505 domain-containing protein [Mycobacterium sp. 1164966.3]OBA82750.1 hypothetical protein A9W99_10170 [Mycobacterium sp. 1164966.3]
MPRSFDMTAEYQGSVEDVFRAFADREYWLARLADSGASESALESMRVGGESGNDGTVEVVILQVIHRQHLPGLITQLHRGDLGVRRKETWSPITDGTATASLAGEIVDAPATLSGTATLVPVAPGGSRVEFQASVQVRVPLIGGKIENVIGAQLAALVEAEQRFTANWIAAHT